MFKVVPVVLGLSLLGRYALKDEWPQVLLPDAGARIREHLHSSSAKRPAIEPRWNEIREREQPPYTPEAPEDRRQAAKPDHIKKSERQVIGQDWERPWFVDQPEHMTSERIHGGID